MTISLEEIYHDYEYIKIINDVLTLELRKLKEIINDYILLNTRSLPKMNPDFKENRDIVDIGKFLGKIVTSKDNNSKNLLFSSYKFTENLLNNHKKEIFFGMQNILSSFNRKASKTPNYNFIENHSFKKNDAQRLKQIFDSI